MVLCAAMRRGGARRLVWLAALLLGAGLALVVLHHRKAEPASDEIDDASKQALREILKQEPE